jgi:DNA-binding GntR family transcriptional regulator
MKAVAFTMAMLLHDPVAVQSLVESITVRLEQAILAGDLPLGSKINEQVIARDLGVSRGPLREAIRCLEGRKLVERIPNLGPRVISLGKADLLDIFVLREALEGISCRIATERITDADLCSLERLTEIYRVDDPTGSGWERSFDQDLDFHLRIVASAGNRRLATILNDELYYLLKIYRHRSKSVPGRAQQAQQEHRDVISAMKERDPNLAEMMMRRHIRSARSNLTKAFETASDGNASSDQLK